MTTGKKRALVVLLAVAAICIVAVILCEIEARRVESTAYRWTSSATLMEMEPGTYYIPGEPEHRTLSNEARRELVTLLNQLPESSFERCEDSPAFSENAVRVSLYGGVGLGYLEKEDRVFIAIIIGDGHGSVSELAEWNIDSTALKQFLSKLAGNHKGV